MSSHVSWRQLACLAVLCYVTLYILCYTYSLFAISASKREFTRKELYDGPLVLRDGKMKYKKPKKGVVQSSLVFLNSAALFDRPAKFYNPKKGNLTLPKLPKTYFDSLTKIAKNIVENDTSPFVYFTFVNDGFTVHMLNWLCNTRIFKGTHERTLVAATSKRVCERIKSEYPDVGCITIVLSREYGIARGYGSQHFVNILKLRAQMMQSLTEAKIPYVLIEPDSVWFRDPIDFFKSRDVVDDADIVVPQAETIKGRHYSFSPMIVYPTKGSVAMLKELNKRLKKEKKIYDLDVLEELCQTQYGGVVCREFEMSEVATGKWFKQSDAERKAYHPYIVNNDYYVGAKEKMVRQMINRLWLLTPKGHCSKPRRTAMMKMWSTDEQPEKPQHKA